MEGGVVRKKSGGGARALGREGCGINPLRGQNNIQGAGDAGAAPSEYPGYQPVDKPANKDKFEKPYCSNRFER